MTKPRIHTHLQTLSDPTRARVLRLLQREELQVGELSTILQLPSPPSAAT